ncbi:MAG: tRNA (N6-isopentenyl adenosine(37)-C2)-methylthiotransferase MiaB [Clostridia bacterium]|nr:tRNA (N6-isopentenyl adenosine(37)-C2)-methylthiotransferase MiaB [Clostridia bacterium]
MPVSAVKHNAAVAAQIATRMAALGKTYHIEAYGCQMNAHDAETMAGIFLSMGYKKASSLQDADVIVFNTCCVREHAEKRVFGNIGALKKRKDENPDLKIIVCGCMPQQREVAERMYKRFPFVDMIVGTNELYMLPELFQRILEGERILHVVDIDGEIAEGLPIHREGTFSTCVNIMYGCNNFCTYCIVPYVRGRERSRTSADILQEVRNVAAEGFKEVMLLGQNVNSYAGDDGTVHFPQLLAMVNGIEEISRIRFMTSHPKDLSPALIDAIASLDKLCKHIHLPVQSGSDRILHAMNRHYTRADYLRIVRMLREKVPEIEITTDIIVGFPGETEADFQDTLSLMREVDYAAAYTFMYSKRKGTKAAAMPEQVEEETKKRRLQELNALQAELLQKGNARFIGTRGTALVEGCDHRSASMAYGRLGNNKMVYFPGDESLVGQMVDVIVTQTQTNSLIGRIATETNR